MHVSHGLKRKEAFGEIAASDLVLTTYALLPRDEKILLDQPFHLVILDETQQIKNAHTHAARVVGRPRANHRLCLTGTPLENHLGELWSLFHFLMPGLLGDAAGFRRVYRTPIEKHADGARREQLVRRMRPARAAVFAVHQHARSDRAGACEAGHCHVRLTGQTRDRERPVKAFQSGKVPLFLISLKAGGAGLNLTAAGTVIHYDPWWNPAVENQATGRAHRIGQVRPVFVYKLIVSGSVEEKIAAMQASKAALARGVLENEGGAGLPLTAEDIQALFEPLR